MSAFELQISKICLGISINVYVYYTDVLVSPLATARKPFYGTGPAFTSFRWQILKYLSTSCKQAGREF